MSRTTMILTSSNAGARNSERGSRITFVLRKSSMAVSAIGRITAVQKQKHIFQIIIEQDEAGFYVAECPALRACYTQGKTYEEVAA